MVDEAKRGFFKSLFREVVQNATTAFKDEEAKPAEDMDRFFESYESSYALTLCYPDDILLETARLEGIACEGREKIDIVKELFQKKGGF
jgi:hypothetical protein